MNQKSNYRASHLGQRSSDPYGVSDMQSSDYSKYTHSYPHNTTGNQMPSQNHASSYGHGGQVSQQIPNTLNPQSSSSQSAGAQGYSEHYSSGTNNNQMGHQNLNTRRSGGGGGVQKERVSYIDSYTAIPEDLYKKLESQAGQDRGVHVPIKTHSGAYVLAHTGVY